MLFRCRVAYGAGHQGMVRSRLGSFNLGVARATGTGGLGRYRIVRIMARDAGFPRIVRIRVDLREARRP